MRFIFVVLPFAVVGCVHTADVGESVGVSEPSASVQNVPPSVSKRSSADDRTASLAVVPRAEGDASGAQHVVPRGLYAEGLKHVEHRLVRKWIKYFTVRERARFQRFLERGEYYRQYIEARLQSHGLPTELYYLAMIESGFRNKARSKAHAVGIWQFMRRTGKHHGLFIDGYVDERMDPARSTAAAISYLQDLHRVYQSWWLAIASYNSGEVRVLRAIMKRDTRDFFKLIEERVLPRETVNYVPKFIAAMYIANNHRRYGFTIPEVSNFDERAFRVYRAPPSLRVADIARRTGCSSKVIKKHNPAIKHNTVHSSRTIALRLPTGCWFKNDNQQRALSALSKKRLKSARRLRVNGQYRVRAGDSLYTLARKFKTSVRALMLANNLQTSRIYVGQSLKIAGSKSTQAGKTTRNLASRKIIKHRVRRGESLYRIARRYNTSIRHIKQINNLKKSNIYPGQIIKISYL